MKRPGLYDDAGPRKRGGCRPAFQRPPVALPETPRARFLDSLARCHGRPDVVRWILTEHPDRASVAGEDLASPAFLAGVCEAAHDPRIGAGMSRWLAPSAWRKLLADAGYQAP